jgi:flagellin-like protein
LNVRHRCHKRPGLSELVGSLLVVAMTIIAGAAVFGYVNSQAGLTEQQYGASVGGVINQIQEKFVVFDISFPSSTSASIWIYNTGHLTLQIASITFSGPAGVILVVYNFTTSAVDQSKTDYVYDVRGSSSCKTLAAAYESPPVSTVMTPATVTTVITVTLPPTRSGCPSYGQTLQSGAAYSVTVLGVYGNAVKASQVK